MVPQCLCKVCNKHHRYINLFNLTFSDFYSPPCIGDTSIIAGVNGPMEVRSQKMAYDKVSVEVTYTPLKGPASKFIWKLKSL